MRSLLILAFITLGIVAAAPAAPPGRAIAIRAQPVKLAPGDPARDRVGALRYLGGWMLSSRDARFGGISAIRVDGDAVTALSDAGTVLTFRITPRGRIRDARAMPLLDGPAVRAGGKRDSESMQYDPASERTWIGFEGANEIWRYTPGFTQGEAFAGPGAYRNWPVNGGAEAMARFADGRFIVFSEEAPGPEGSTAALLYGVDPTTPGAQPVRFGYRAPDGYRVTDAGVLADGRLVLINRRFTIMEGASAIVTIADPRTITEGGVLVPRAIATLAAPLTVDNMEALSIVRDGGRTILWIASDDNFNPLQRTLLLKFALEAD